jgi:hypothetical protein
MPFIAAILLVFAASASQAGSYIFDDVYGTSGAGAQWVVITEGYGTAGDRIGASTPLSASADFVASVDHVYLRSGGITVPEPIQNIFLVHPGYDFSMWVDFGWSNPTYTEADTPDVAIDFGDPGSEKYLVAKDDLSTTFGASKKWRFDLTKNGSTRYETTRGNMIFHLNPRLAASQTLQIPMIVANVHDYSAEQQPLLFRSTMRENYSENTLSSDIVAYDRFTWDVTSNFEVGNKTDWVFVPVSALPIDANYRDRVYRLRTDITNYSGIRYALQRYDMSPMYPSRWAMDLPVDVKDVEPNILLDTRSQIPPGLITTYDQPFNVVSGVKEIFRMYPVDPPVPSGFRELTLSHPSIFGLQYGSAMRGDGYTVIGFDLLASDKEFMDKLSSANGVRKAVSPEQDDDVMNADAFSQGYIAGDAINTMEINAKVPSRLNTASEDLTGVLPLHVTFNLPHRNRFIAQRWDALLEEWKNSGRVKNMFSNQFTLYMQFADGKTYDIFEWLKANSAFDNTVKVFIDESRDCVTVSFIVILLDADSTSIRMVGDQTVTTDNNYMTIRDGGSDGMWKATFFTAPANYVPTEPSGNLGGESGGGGGGGCASGTFAAISLLSAAAMCLVKRNER